MGADVAGACRGFRFCGGGPLQLAASPVAAIIVWPECAWAEVLPAGLRRSGGWRTMSVAVRAIGRLDARAHGHIADSVGAADAERRRLRRSGAIWCEQERNTVKPSAQPTLVRTQHLPPPAKTARSLRKRGPAGRSFLSRRVSSCTAVGHCVAMLRTYR